LKEGKITMTAVNFNEAEIMTVNEVAEYLKISEVTTYKLVQEGKIPAFKIGRHWRVKRIDLEEFIEKLKLGERL
jgi:excisionase family DNA binding protein